MENQKLLIASYKKAVDMNLIISITDSKGKIIYANRKFCEISKYSKLELIGQNHRIINSGVHSRDFFERMWMTISKGDTWKGEIINKAKDGSLYWVDTVILPITKGAKRQYLSLRMDITERKELEFKKEEYNRSLEDILFMISHEVRRPLTSILGLIDLYNNSNISADDVRKIHEYLKLSAQELDKLILEMNEYVINVKKDLEK